MRAEISLFALASFALGCPLDITNTGSDGTNSQDSGRGSDSGQIVDGGLQDAAVAIDANCSSVIPSGPCSGYCQEKTLIGDVSVYSGRNFARLVGIECVTGYLLVESECENALISMEQWRRSLPACIPRQSLGTSSAAATWHDSVEVMGFETSSIPCTYTTNEQP